MARSDISYICTRKGVISMEQGKPTLRMDKVNQVLELFNMELGAIPISKEH